MKTSCAFPVSVGLLLSTLIAMATEPARPTWREGEQLPRRMHTAMEDLPSIRVGPRDADIVGTDHRALQAAVDYIAGLGGGVVEIAAGEYRMRDSLHLRPRVHVRGVAGRTVLKKAAAASSPLKLDGDYGEEQVTLEQADGFAVGDGIAVWDKNSGGFHTTVARIVGRRGTTLAISKPLNADCMVDGGATAATVFPVVSGYDLEGVVVEGLVIDGNKGENPMLNGCRGAGIFLYRAFGTVVRDCVVRGYSGDGIGFQQSNDVVVERCTVEQNAGLGFHPGSGSQRPTIRECVARGNGEDGLFLCWRVKYGLFENNLLEGNGRFGISIGHKDTDNLFRNNRVRANAQDGFFFRNERDGMAGHRNELVGNVVENNGLTNNAAAIRVRGATRDLILRDNVLRETRAEGERRQTVGVLVEDWAGNVSVEGNRVENATPLVDRRP